MLCRCSFFPPTKATLAQCLIIQVTRLQPEHWCAAGLGVACLQARGWAQQSLVAVARQACSHAAGCVVHRCSSVSSLGAGWVGELGVGLLVGCGCTCSP